VARPATFPSRSCWETCPGSSCSPIRRGSPP
jgi:hypothetical protein